MEDKKTEKADLEKHRTERFLLGLVCALALFFGALEYTTWSAAEDGDGGALEELAEDLELMPAADVKDMTVAAPRPVSQSITENVRETEAPVETSDKISTTTSDVAGDGGEGAVEESHTAEPLSPPIPKDEDAVQTKVEELPEFPGGMVEFMKWLTRNLQYPHDAEQQHIEGRVVVTFIVNKDGSIANPKVSKPGNSRLDAEALRVVRMMPRWTPGKINNRPCRTMIAIPINFKI